MCYRARTMIVQKVRISGNSYIVTIPKEEVDRLQLAEGDLVGVEFRKMELRPQLTPELREAAEHSWERAAEAYRYLIDR